MTYIRTRRMVSIIFAVTVLVSTLWYTEHSLARPFKGFASLVGVIDSDQVLVGITDIRSIDHVYGDRGAAVVLIEYSDFGCVICGAMQGSLRRIVQEEGVAVVSRHLYPNKESRSFHDAIAAECVAKHHGEEAYSSFVSFLYRNQHQRQPDDIFQQAASLGVSSSDFQGCISNDSEVRQRVIGDSEEAQRLGAAGTPYIVVVYNGKPVGISYANEYSRFRDRVALLVSQARNSGA